MDENIPQEILHDLLTSLEALETQTAAILEFLKAKGIASEEELAPYLERAGNASNVRWLAARVRMDRLISSALKAAEADAKKEPSKTETDPQSRPAGEVKAQKEETQEKTQTKLQAAEPDTKKEPSKTEAGQPSRPTDEVRAQEEKAQEKIQTKQTKKQTEKAVHVEQQESGKEDSARATDGRKQEGKQEGKNDKQTEPDHTEPNPTKKPASDKAA